MQYMTEKVTRTGRSATKDAYESTWGEIIGEMRGSVNERERNGISKIETSKERAVTVHPMRE